MNPLPPFPRESQPGSPAPSARESVRAVLRRRAAALAKVPESGGASDALDVVEFSLSGERYAVAAAAVVEVLPFIECTPLPCTPAFVVGIVNVRGRIRHVIDLRGFFDLPGKGIVDLHHIVLVRHEGVEAGLLADLVTGLRTIPVASLQAALPTFAGIRADYLRGVTPDGLAVLEAASILGDRRQVVQEEVPS